MNSYCLVTGATGDIGFAIASRLAEVGHHVILNARSSDVLERRATELKDHLNTDVEVLTSLGPRS